ncbi:MAG: aminotransferase class I/II-fold pyridoxal phosphate-dependent enzyme [candidate division Zixibacteria bacterium]|nr:aminotransferase class I/II-fold pyridoxal phosphate-dependent enzyme [candidate division Zixibacteria bacterium]
MKTIENLQFRTAEESLQHILPLLGTQFKVEPNSLLVYNDSTDFMTALLAVWNEPSTKLVVAGHCTPDLAISADRAGIEIIEALSLSPFSGDVEAVLSQIERSEDIVFIANPNRLTGSSFSMADIEQFAQAVPRGLVIIDEYYIDYFGATALPLLQQYTNLVILRSLHGHTTAISHAAGVLIGSASTMRKIRNEIRLEKISSQTIALAAKAIEAGSSVAEQVISTHEEMLRIATVLTKLGVHYRLVATDFMLIRVAQPIQAGNWLVREGVNFENLDGYPGLEGYLRYSIHSVNMNALLTRAFQSMPKESYAINRMDNRPVTLRKGTSESEPMPMAKESVFDVRRVSVYRADKNAKVEIS